jgi:hypothetical protein
VIFTVYDGLVPP